MLINVYIFLHICVGQDGDDFEDQGSSSDESEVLERQAQEEEEDDGIEYLGR